MNLNNMNILFRVDSSFTIGTGHIMRDLVLSSQYKNDNIIFATQNLSGNINYKVIESGYKVEILKSNKSNQLIKLIKKFKINLLVIDHYEIDYKYEKKIKDKTGVKILSFDDTYEKHYCDILLNHNINATKKKYKDLVPKNCKIKCGSKFTLLREEFYKEKAKKQKKLNQKTKNVFIAMGGADHSNINIDILKVIKKFKNLNINIVTTEANKNLDVLKKYCNNKKNITLHINSNQIAKLMKNSYFSIVTPSVTVNEVYFMNLPFIAIKTATNQEEIYRYLKKKKYLVMEKFSKSTLKKYLYKIMKELKDKQ